MGEHKLGMFFFSFCGDYTEEYLSILHELCLHNANYVEYGKRSATAVQREKLRAEVFHFASVVQLHEYGYMGDVA